MSSRSRIKGVRWTLAATLAAGALLGGCSDIYYDRRETVALGANDAVETNKVTHMVDPWPRRASDRDIGFDGERMAAAAERYRTNKVTPPSGTGTSSVKYEPVLMQPAPK